MLKPMLTNYLGLLTTSLTDVSALAMCATVRGMLDYVEYGAGVFRDNETCRDTIKKCGQDLCTETYASRVCRGCGAYVQEELDDEVISQQEEKPHFGGRVAPGSGNIINYV